MARSASIKTKDEFAAWLIQNQINYDGLEESDVDGDGLNDWIVLLGTQNYGSLDLWAVLRTNTGIDPIRVKSIGFWPGHGHSNVQVYRPDPKSKVDVAVYQWEDHILAFHLIKNKRKFEVVLDVDFINDFGTISKAINWELQETANGNHLIVVYDNAKNEYGWDPNQGKLVLTNGSTFLQEQTIAQVEEWIYRQGQYQKAIEILKPMLAGKIREDLVWAQGAGVKNPPRIRPYAQYLLGLAYEMNGDALNAIKAYWQLWHDYPESPYVLAILRKLAPIKA